MHHTFRGRTAVAMILCLVVGLSNADPVALPILAGYFSWSFGDSRLPAQLHYGAGLALDRRSEEPRFPGPVTEATAPRFANRSLLQPYVQLDMDQGRAATVKLLGSDVAGYRYQLDETQTASESPGWFSRNWGWVAAAGVVVVAGTVAAVGGGIHSSNDSNSGTNNCTPSQPISVMDQCGNVASGSGTR